MLYHLLYPLHTTFSVFNVFRYITFRTIYASLTAFLICFLLGPWMIRKLREMQIGQYIRDDGPKSHLDKAGTPTMGGSLIILSIAVSILLWSDLTNYFVWITLFVVIGYGLVGFIDDYMMLVKRRSKGLGVRSKLVLQALIALIAGFLVYVSPDFSTTITIPFFKNITPDLGLGLYYICSICHCRRLKRRKSYRRPGRPGHRTGDHRRDDLLVFRLCRRSRKTCRLPAN